MSWDPIRFFAGFQATDLHETYLRMGGDDPDLMPVATRRWLCDLLRALGYRERWATADDENAHLMWVRDPWLEDAEVLASCRETETYVAVFKSQHT